MTQYSRQDVLRILQLSAHQLQSWERAALIPSQQAYTFQDLAQLRTLRSLREESVSVSSIRESVFAMKAVAGMANPLLEARIVKTGRRIAFRQAGALVDPIERQLLFDFDSSTQAQPLAHRAPVRMPNAANGSDRFLSAVQAEEAGQKQRAIEIYEEIIERDPNHAAAYINLGTLSFHLKHFHRAEELYRKATEVDPGYALAFFDLGNVLDELGRSEESIDAYTAAIRLSPSYADAHYNLALAFERKGEPRRALKFWQNYLKLDATGPWSEHAKTRIQKLLKREKLEICTRTEGLHSQATRAAISGTAALRLV